MTIPYKENLKLFFFFLLAVLFHYWFISHLLKLEVVLVPMKINISAHLKSPVENETEGEEEKKEKGKKKAKGKPASKEQREKFLSEWGDLINDLESAKKIKGASIEEIDNILPNSDVSDSYIHRKRDYEDIMVKEVFPTVHDIDKKFDELIKKSPQKLERYHERNRIIDEFRNDGEISIQKGLNIRMKHPQKDAKVPLDFPLAQRKKYFDETLPLSKEKQLAMFMDKYLGYHPNKGDLPTAIRDLYYKNLQRIAYTFSTDETYFYLDYFQENLNKEDFLMNAQAIAANLQGTKTAIEILFAMDNIYDIQSRALLFLKRFEIESENYPQEKQNRLHYQSMKYLLKRYLPELKAKGLNTQVDITRKYQEKRLEILNYMQKTTPKNYREKDILFEQAAVYFQLGRMEGNIAYIKKAEKIWRSLKNKNSAGDFLNEKANLQILNLLKNTDIFKVENEIDIILRTRYNEKIMEKIEREKQLLYP